MSTTGTSCALAQVLEQTPPFAVAVLRLGLERTLINMLRDVQQNKRLDAELLQLGNEEFLTHFGW